MRASAHQQDDSSACPDRERQSRPTATRCASVVAPGRHDGASGVATATGSSGSRVARFYSLHGPLPGIAAPMFSNVRSYFPNKASTARYNLADGHGIASPNCDLAEMLPFPHQCPHLQYCPNSATNSGLCVSSVSK